MKRSLSILLLIMLCLNLMAVGAMAEEPEAQTAPESTVEEGSAALNPRWEGLTAVCDAFEGARWYNFRLIKGGETIHEDLVSANEYDFSDYLSGGEVYFHVRAFDSQRRALADAWSETKSFDVWQITYLPYNAADPTDGYTASVVRGAMLTLPAWPEIAEQMNRPVESIRARMFYMGLTKEAPISLHT